MEHTRAPRAHKRLPASITHARTVSVFTKICMLSAGAAAAVLLCTQASRRHKTSKMPKLMDVIAALPESHRARLSPLLLTKPVRTASGIAVVAVMCKPHRCPHIATTGNVCVYCPGGPDSDFEYSTQSYTGCGGGARRYRGG